MGAFRHWGGGCALQIADGFFGEVERKADLLEMGAFCVVDQAVFPGDLQLLAVEVAPLAQLEGEAGREDARRHGDYAHSDHHHEHAEHLAAQRDRCDIAVAHRGECSHGPPERGRNRAEGFGLSLVLEDIGATAGHQQAEHHDERGGTERLPLHAQHIEQNVQGGEVVGELEDPN